MNVSTSRHARHRRWPSARLFGGAAAIGFAAAAVPTGAQTIDKEKSICLEHYETEQPDRIILACTSVIAFRTLRDADRSLAFFRRAEANLIKRRLTLALADYDAAIAIAPGMADAHFGRGVVHMGMSVPGEPALADFDAAIRLDPRHDRAFNNRSLIQPDEEKALADISEAIRIAPRATYYNNRAHILTRRGDHKGALSDYSRAVELDPSESSYRSKRGDTLIELGAVKKAIADYTVAIALAPKIPRNHSGRAAAYERIGAHTKALADVREALRLFPGDWQARDLLCKLVPSAQRTADEQRTCPTVPSGHP